MQTEVASRSAGTVAAARALVSLAPLKERILVDPYARYLVNGYFERIAKYLRYERVAQTLYGAINRYAQWVVKMPNPALPVALRHRYIDDRVRALIAQGYTQIVILGAGFDTRAYRLHTPDVHFIEIDHPATQAEKLKRLPNIPNLPDANVSHIALDFCDRWGDDLIASDQIQTQASVVVWEGVTMYLTEEQIRYTLQTIASLCGLDTHILFDISCLEPERREMQQKTRRGLKKVISKHEEPFRFSIQPELLEPLLTSEQYSICELKRPSEIRQDLMQQHAYLLPSVKHLDSLVLVDACYTGAGEKKQL